jgi:fumarate reductase flavoprotein subunit
MKNKGLLFIGAFIFLILLLSCADANSPVPEVYTPGVYTGEAPSYGGVLKVRSEFSGTAIVSVQIIEHYDTRTRPAVSDALRIIPQRIAIKGSAGVDTVSGATITSNRILDAVEDCAEQARITKKDTPKPDDYQFINNSAFTLAISAGSDSFGLKPGDKKTVTISGSLDYTYTGTGYYSVTPRESPGAVIFVNE